MHGYCKSVRHSPLPAPDGVQYQQHNGRVILLTTPTNQGCQRPVAMQTQQFMSNLYNTLCYILFFCLPSGWQLAMSGYTDGLHFAKTYTD